MEIEGHHCFDFTGLRRLPIVLQGYKEVAFQTDLNNKGKPGINLHAR